MTTFVVVGAGVAGGTAAAKLREEGFDGNVVLIGAEDVAPYERPPLSKEYLRGETSEPLYIRDRGSTRRTGSTPGSASAPST